MLAFGIRRHAGTPRAGATLVRLAAVALVAAWGLAGCVRGGGQAQPPTTPAGPAVGTAPTATASTTPPGATASAGPVLANGQHVVYLTGLDVPGRTITFDLIEFLTGEAANQACIAHQGPECPPPNDYFIVNDNPKLRTLPVSDQVVAKVLPNPGSVTPIPIAFADLPAHFATTKTGGQLSHLPFRLTVTNATVVAFEEIYLP